MGEVVGRYSFLPQMEFVAGGMGFEEFERAQSMAASLP